MNWRQNKNIKARQKLKETWITSNTQKFQNRPWSIRNHWTSYTMIPSIHFSPFWSINNISYTNHHKSNLIQFKTPNLKQNTKKPAEINTKTNKLPFTTAFTCPNVNNFKTLTHKIVTKIEKFTLLSEKITTHFMADWCV